MTLDELSVGHSGVITAVGGEGSFGAGCLIWVSSRTRAYTSAKLRPWATPWSCFCAAIRSRCARRMRAASRLRRTQNDLRTGWQPELRQNDAFNQLTGSNQHVGNFPGVTVDQKSGPVRGQKDCTVVDLPGIYSLRPYTAEGDRHTRFYSEKQAGRHHQHRRRDQFRAQSLSDAPIIDAARADGAGAQHDGRADRQRRQHRHG